MADAITRGLPKNPSREDIVDWVDANGGVSRAEAEKIVTGASYWSRYNGDPAQAEYLMAQVRAFKQEQAKQDQARQEAEGTRSADAATSAAQEKKAKGLFDAMGLQGSFDQQLADYQRQRGINAGNGILDAATMSDIDASLAFVASKGPAKGASTAPAGPPAQPGTPPPPGDVAQPWQATRGWRSPTQGSTDVDDGTSVDMPAELGDLGGTPNPDGKFGIPGGAQVWAGPDGFWYAVYTVPGTIPPVPMAWQIENNDDVAAIFGPGNEWKVDRTLTDEEWQAAGVLKFGNSRVLANQSEHPFDAFVSNFATEASIRPWLRDPEILALTTRAILENRTVSDAELSSTQWWRTHTEGERQWIATFNADPKTAQQRVQDGRDQARKTMIAAGIAEPPDQLVNLFGDRMTGGTWTQAYANSQIAKIADPAAPGVLDDTVKAWLGDLRSLDGTPMQLNTLADNTMKVEQLVRQWLGPAYGAAGWTKEQIGTWSGRLRNDPQAEEELTRQLQTQRMQLFPEYTDPNASYDDIASTWRGVVQNTWGEVPDETDPMFLNIVRMNDLGSAQKFLREEGRKRGVKKVVDGDLAVLNEAFGGSLRRSA